MRLRVASLIYVTALLLLALSPLLVNRQRAQFDPGMEMPMMQVHERHS